MSTGSDGGDQSSDSKDDVDDGSSLTWEAIKGAMPPAVVGVITALTTLANAEPLGVSFTEDPLGFFQALISKYLIETVLNIFGFFGLKIQQAGLLSVDVLEESGGAVYGSIAFVGGSILGIFTGMSSTLGDLAASSPFGMIIALLIWIGIAYLAIYGAVQTWKALKQLIPWVIPWL